MKEDTRIEGRPPFLRIHNIFLLLLLSLALYLTFLILRPFFDTIMLAVVLASIFFPVQVRLVRLFRGRKNLAALTVMVIITFAIIIPAAVLASALISQGVQSIAKINEWISEGNPQKLLEDQRVASYLTWAHGRLGTSFSLERFRIQESLLEATKNIGQFLLARGADLVGGVASAVFHFFVMVFVSFYLIRDGERMIMQVKYLSPLREEQEDRIIDRIRQVTRSVLLGTLVTALIQGLVGGVGLAIVGIPGLFWGAVMGFASLVPIVGTALIWIPAVIYLIITGYTKAAIFLTLWSVLIVGSIDNFLRPFFMKGDGGLSPFYVFLAIIGGVQIFGLIGVLYGPLILSFAMVVLYIYSVEYRDILEAHTIEPVVPPDELLGESDD